MGNIAIHSFDDLVIKFGKRFSGPITNIFEEYKVGQRNIVVMRGKFCLYTIRIYLSFHALSHRSNGVIQPFIRQLKFGKIGRNRCQSRNFHRKPIVSSMKMPVVVGVVRQTAQYEQLGCRRKVFAVYQAIKNLRPSLGPCRYFQSTPDRFRTFYGRIGHTFNDEISQ